MALGTPTAPTVPVSGNGVSSVQSAPFTPVGSALLFAHQARRHIASIAGSTCTSTPALTWTLLTDESVDSGSGTRSRQRVFVAVTAASPPSLTVTMGGVSDGGRATLQMLQLPGTIVVPTNFDSAQDQVGADPTTTLPNAPQPASVLLGFFAGTAAGDTPVTPPAGFTAEIEDAWNATGSLQMQTCYKADTGAQVNAWSTIIPATGMASVIEVRQPAAGGEDFMAVWS